MPRRIIAASLIATAAVTAAALSSAPARPAEEKPAANPKVVALRKEKVEKLKAVVDFFQQRQAGGLARPHLVPMAKVALGYAELDLAATDAEQVVVLQRMLTEAKAAEAFLKELKASGNVDAVGIMRDDIQAMTARIDVEIMLEKLKAK